MKTELPSKRITAGRLISVVCLLFALRAAGGSYYIDFASGSDANSGTSTAAAWQHCPGDLAATGVAARKKLQPGDMACFKGGVTYSNPMITCNDGALILQGNQGVIDVNGVFSDSSASFGGVLPGDLLYIYNGSATGAFVDICGEWAITNVAGGSLQVQGFGAFGHSTPELTYIICRPVIYATSSAFGSGPAILDGSGTNRWYFKYGNYNLFSGLVLQNSKDVAATGCTDGTWGIFYENTGSPMYGLFIQDCLFSNIWSGVYPTAGQVYQVFQNNTVRDYESYGLLGGAYTLAQNNYFTNGVGGVRNVGAYSIIRSNQIVCMTTICGSHSDGIGPIFSPSATPGGNVYGWIYNNFIEGVVQGIFLTSNNGGTYGWTIANNVLVGTLGNSYSGPGSVAIFIEGAPNTRIYNNVILGTNGATGWISGMNIGNRDIAPTTLSSNVQIANNIIYNPGTGIMGALHVYSTAATNGLWCEGNIYCDKNLAYNADWGFDSLPAMTFGQWQARGFDKAGNSLYLSKTNFIPLFVNAVGFNPGDFDLHLSPNSPALSSPYSLPVPLANADHYRRSSDTNLWDRGVFQMKRALPTPFNNHASAQ